ncbi:tetratricopeptide repeat protein, partial [Candidatus Atribacteria bacterium 1244-E10-H5-B2]
MKKNITFLLLVIIIISIFCLSLIVSSSQTINVKDYIKDKFLSAFILYLYSLEDLDSDEKEFIDLLENLPGEEQEYYAKEVYKNGFSLDLLKKVKEAEAIQVPASDPALPSTSKQKEESTESLPSLIKKIKPSVVIVFAYDNKGEFLKLGNGFFISQNGDIITNYHLLQEASSAEIKTSDGKTYPITYIIAKDEQNDITRLSVDIPSKYVLPLSLSETIPEIRERIIVYGNPLELENPGSDGIVSSVREIFNYGKIIQITAPISPGSSGSPVLNMKGEVIGIATFQFIEGRKLNFAIPSERIASLNLAGEKKTSVGEELFEQEEKDKKDFDYAYEAYDKALYFMDKREHEKALPYLGIAIKTDISSLKARAYLQIGFCYGMLGSHTKEIEVYIQAIRVDTDDAIAHYSLGIAYFKLGFHEGAVEAFKQAI